MDSKIGLTMKEGPKPYLETEYHIDHPEYPSNHITIDINH